MKFIIRSWYIHALLFELKLEILIMILKPKFIQISFFLITTGVW